MSADIAKKDSDENMSIALPMRKRDLGNFISNLLGQQQSFKRQVTAKFDIDHAWLVNLHELLHQRIKQQADSTLIEFVAQIHFDSGLKRTITTVDSFQAYVETKKEAIVAVTLLWSYLVQFPGRSFPDKQEITFHARVRREEYIKKEEKTNPIVNYVVGAMSAESDRSYMAYSVSHTERTWGDDIESLLSNQVEDVIRHEGGVTDTVYNCLRWALVFGVFMFFMIFPLYHTSNNTALILTDLNMQYENIDSDPVSLAVLNEKLDIATNMIKAMGVKDRRIYLSLLIFLAPFVCAFLIRATRKNLHSFIVLSHHDKIQREKFLKGERNSVRITVASYIFAILAGILGNYGYSWLNEPADKKAASDINQSSIPTSNPYSKK